MVWIVISVCIIVLQPLMIQNVVNQSSYPLLRLPEQRRFSGNIFTHERSLGNLPMTGNFATRSAKLLRLAKTAVIWSAYAAWNW
jgi:hypothetical protein